jgi:tRNA pseudouridine38-40 synthase
VVRKVVLVVEYDGTRYCGFQLQRNVPTIQAELEHALLKLVGERVRIVAASRTDAGVHAKGQVVSFRTDKTFPPKIWIKALNFYLPQDIAVKAAYEVDNSFNVRRDALSREYHYHILNGFTRSLLRRGVALFIPQLLDIEAMNRACQVLIGEHDFAPFSPSMERGTVRTIYKAEVHQEKDLVIFVIEASSFLPHQVRHIMGSLIRVGLGKTEVETFWKLARSNQSGIIGPAAPAYSLCLVKINYPDFPTGEQWNENLQP